MLLPLLAALLATLLLLPQSISGGGPTILPPVPIIPASISGGGPT